MSKRGALFQGSKETGLDLEMDGTPGESPQRATAAQMASRKIRDVRRRPRPASSSGSAGNPSFSPFSAIDPNTVSSTPAPQSSGQFMFGQSQSFPGAGSTPNQTDQNAPAPFAFGTGSGVPSSSFNFNSAASSSAVGNPFANMNNGLSNQPPSSNGFGGFKGSIFNLPPSENRASSPQPSGTGLFGSQQFSSTGGLFGGFGNSTTATGPPSQPAQTTGAATSSIFGQPGTTTTAPSTSVFSPSTPVKGPAFGQSTGFGGDTMQTSPDTNNNGSGKSTSLSSSSFGGGSTPLFGAGTKSEDKPSFSTPAKSLFGAKPAESSTPPTPSLFGAASSTAETKPAPTTTTAAPEPSAPVSTSSATPTTTSTLFGNQSPVNTTAPMQNPFQTSNLFAGIPKASEDKKVAEEKQGEVSTQPKTGFQFAPPTTGGTSLFSNSASAAPAATSGGLFGNKPTFGTPQPTSSATNPFAPKPTAPAGQEKSEPTQSNPFGSLFAPPAAKPASAEKPSEDKPQPAQNPFANMFAPKPSLPTTEGSKTSESQGQGARPSLFSTSTPKPSGIFSSQPSAEKPSIFSAPATEPKTQPLDPVSASHTQPIFKSKEVGSTAAAPTTAEVDGLQPTAPLGQLTQPPAKPTTTPARFQDLRPQNIPSSLDRNLKDDVDLLWRVRTLNECFKRRLADLDPSTDDFDALVLYYMRVRETIGAPTGLGKRKTRDDESAADAAVDGDAPVPKKVKSSEFPASGEQLSDRADPPGKDGAAPASPASDMKITQSPITSTPSKLFGTPSQDTSGGKKRKSSEDEGEPTASSGTSLGKRVKELDESRSTTASIFARSFSNSVSSETGNEAPNGDSSKTQTSSFFQSSVSEPSKPASGSTTPTTSPSKPIFSFSTAPKESPAASTSLFSPSASVSKPTFGTVVNNGSAEPPKNPFVLKPMESKDTDSSAKTAAGPPKFGSGSGTNFFSQFQKQADENAAKEKAKRKAEDYDSEEEDEAEWERKDAEAQRKKREEFEARSQNRPKFVPGKGFSFDGSPETSAESKETEKISVNESTSSAGTSIFDSKNASSFKSNNIFGHLSATPSEAGENDDANDTEEASGDEEKDDPKDSFAPVVDGQNSDDATGAKTSGNGNANNTDIFKTAEKESEQKAASEETSDAATAPAPSGGRSLFDRVQHNSDGNQGNASPSDENASSKPFSGLFGSSKFASPFNITPGPSSNIFAQNNESSSAQGSTTSSIAGSGNIFGSSGGKTSGLFGSPAPVFGSGTASKSIGDTGSPIKFTLDSTSTSGSESKKPEVGTAAAPTANQPKPFSALFGGSSAGTKPSSGTPQQPLFGFGFGGPSQQGKSSLTPSAATSDAPSRSTTPGLTSDTGAEETAQDEADDSLPQLDLAHSKAGEENEDLVMETRARALKFESGSWDSKGVGFLRVLKNPTNSRSRIIVRGDPSGKVIVNAALKKEIPYSASGSNVQFFVPQPDGGLEKWAVRVKKEDAESLVSAIEECRK